MGGRKADELRLCRLVTGDFEFKVEESATLDPTKLGTVSRPVFGLSPTAQTPFHVASDAAFLAGGLTF